MCDPISLGVASIAMSAGSSIMQGQAAQQAANANAAAAAENARLAREQANLVEEKKARDLSMIQRQEQQTSGAQRVAGAGAGLDMSYGSGLNILESTALMSQEDQNNTEINTANDKWGLANQASQYDNQSAQFKAQGENAMNAGIMGAATSVVSGTFGTVAPRWYPGKSYR